MQQVITNDYLSNVWLWALMKMYITDRTAYHSAQLVPFSGWGRGCLSGPNSVINFKFKQYISRHRQKNIGQIWYITQAMMTAIGTIFARPTIYNHEVDMVCYWLD